MNDIDYLNQIAKDNRAASISKEDRAFNTKIIKIVIGAILGVILLMIIGGLLGNLGNKERDILDKIYARTVNLNTTITEYNDRVKSSELRSMGNSLSAVLSETSGKIANILTTTYETTDPRDESTTTDEATHIEEVNSNLYYGRINGLLDRYYVRELTKEITLLKSLELEAIENTSDSSITDALVSSWNNLNRLEQQFEEYSDLAN